jgi:hypothetical protein
MELSFACETSAEASYLAQELELALRDEGIPADAVLLKPSSSESMDIGSTLWISIEMAAQVLGPIASIASFAKCIFEIVHKYNSDIVIGKPEGKVKIPAATIDFTRIQEILAESLRPNTK